MGATGRRAHSMPCVYMLRGEPELWRNNTPIQGSVVGREPIENKTLVDAVPP